MCISCTSCKCCSDKDWTTFFAIWNICWGVLILAGNIDGLLDSPEEWRSGLSKVRKVEWSENAVKIVRTLSYLSCVFAGSYTVSGILILIGDATNRKWIFTLGKYLSYLMPCWGFLSIYLPIVHFITVCKVCRYSRSRWP